MNNFLTNKKTEMIPFFVSLGLLFFIMFLGFGSVDYYYSYSYDHNYSMYDLDFTVPFVSVSLGLMLIYTPVIIVDFLGKIKHIRTIKTFALFIYSGVITLMVFFIIFAIEFFNTPIGTLIIVFSFIISVLVIALFLLNIYLLAKMPRLMSRKKEEKIKKQQSIYSVQRLKQLKELLDLGAISKEEFEEKKKKYINYL